MIFCWGGGGGVQTNVCEASIRCFGKYREQRFFHALTMPTASPESQPYCQNVNSFQQDSDTLSILLLLVNCCCFFVPIVSIGMASANSAKFRGIRPLMYIKDLL